MILALLGNSQRSSLHLALQATTFALQRRRPSTSLRELGPLGTSQGTQFSGCPLLKPHLCTFAAQLYVQGGAAALKPGVQRGFSPCAILKGATL